MGRGLALLVGLGGAALLALYPRKTEAYGTQQLNPSVGSNGAAYTPQTGGLADFDWEKVWKAVAYAGERSHDWGTLNSSDSGQGVSWGLLQFNQGAGSLGAVLAQWRAVDPVGFDTIWRVWTESPAAMVEDLTSSDRARRLRRVLGYGQAVDCWHRSGLQSAAQAAQLTVAWSMYWEPIADLTLSVLGPGNAAAACAYDCAIKQGTGACRKALEATRARGAAPGEQALAIFLEERIRLAPAAADAIAARTARVLLYVQTA